MPRRAGVGLKAEHCRLIVETAPDMGFFEVHAENYMGAGGPPHRYLSAIRALYPLSIHGVGLSIGGTGRLEQDHLRRLGDLVDRYEPALVSEHLAWSSHGGAFLNDLLPVPYTKETLARVAGHVGQVQDFLGRPLLLENPSSYVTFAASTYSEPEFLAEIVARTGCHLLLDINNVHVAAINHGWDPAAYVAACPLGAVREIHLAGHARETDGKGRPLLVDTHDRPVGEEVWALYARALRHVGAIPTLIEWDMAVPDWPVLAAEAARAEALMRRVVEQEVTIVLS